MAEQRNIRASDADRTRIAEQLRRATDEGRLLAHEFEDRLEQALSARTYGELDAIVADLPREQVPAERPGRVGALLRRRPGPVVRAAAVAGAIAATVVLLLSPPTARQVVSPQAAARSPAVGVVIQPKGPLGAKGEITPVPPAPQAPQPPKPPAALP